MEENGTVDPYAELKRQLMRFSDAEEALEWVETWSKKFPLSKKTLVIKMPLITHIAFTDNKIKSNKVMKINGQTIYNGALNKFKRAIVVQNMHYYFEYNIPYEMLGLELKKVKKIKYIFHTVINHGNISMRRGVRTWLLAKKNYEPNWDIENLATIWMKTGNDALSAAKVFSDDNVSVIKKASYEMVEVDHIDDLELEVRIYY